MQICRTCKIEKPVEAFSRDARARSGINSQCRVCAVSRYKPEYRQKYAATHREQERERDRKRRQQPGYQEKYRARLRGTKKHLARVALRNAVQAGSVIKPNYCEGCNQIMNRRFIHGHHPDYDKPFDVKWLCATCHNAEHRALLNESTNDPQEVK